MPVPPGTSRHPNSRSYFDTGGKGLADCRFDCLHALRDSALDTHLCPTLLRDGLVRPSTWSSRVVARDTRVQPDARQSAEPGLPMMSTVKLNI